MHNNYGQSRYLYGWTFSFTEAGGYRRQRTCSMATYDLTINLSARLLHLIALIVYITIVFNTVGVSSLC